MEIKTLLLSVAALLSIVGSTQLLKATTSHDYSHSIFRPQPQHINTSSSAVQQQVEL